MLIWKDNTGGYLWGIKEYGLLATEKHKQYRKRKTEKSAFIIRSIVNIFLA